MASRSVLHRLTSAPGSALVLTLLGLALGCRRPDDDMAAGRATASPPASIDARTLAGPEGTRDASTLLAHDEGLFACVRGSRDGLFELWALRTPASSWQRVAGRRFRLPIAMGVRGASHVAVADGEAGQVRLWTFEAGEVVAGVVVPGLVRAIVPDDAGGWWLGGTFHVAGETYLACHAPAGREPVPLRSTRISADRLGPGMDWTGLIRVGKDLLVSSPMIPDILLVDPTADTSRRWTSLTESLPDLDLSCLGEKVPSARDPEAMATWHRERAVPVGLFAVAGRPALLVRHAARDAWFLAMFDETGQPAGRHELPLQHVPFGVSGRSVWTHRKDLEQAGEPVRLQLVALDAVPLDRPAASAGSGHSTRTVREPLNDLPAESPLLFVDPRICVGDVQALLVEAQAAGSLPRAEMTLAVLGGAGEGYGWESVVRSVERQVPLREQVLSWLIDVPPAAARIGPGLWVLRDASPDAETAGEVRPRQPANGEMSSSESP